MLNQIKNSEYLRVLSMLLVNKYIHSPREYQRLNVTLWRNTNCAAVAVIPPDPPAPPMTWLTYSAGEYLQCTREQILVKRELVFIFQLSRPRCPVWLRVSSEHQSQVRAAAQCEAGNKERPHSPPLRTLICKQVFFVSARQIFIAINLVHGLKVIRAVLSSSTSSYPQPAEFFFFF